MATKRQDIHESILDKFKDALRTGKAKNLSVKAKDWFRSKFQQGRKMARQTYRGARASAIGGMSGMKPNDLFKKGGYTKVQFTDKKTVYGKMFFYEYDAKYKATLPYWDRYPVTIFFDYKPPHLMGLNLHYLPPYHRAALMDAIFKYKSSPELDSNTFLRLNWNQLRRIPEVKPAVKKYLVSNVGYAVQIPADEWDVAVYLPVARWQKGSEAQVYKDSKDMLKDK
tara:strand:- start:2007 stop:2681 length:675 start_codon:yes stop_codon:yes gene_type:complete